jgi:hypothetical protein
VYFNVNNLKNLLVANNGNNYFQNVKMLTKKERKKVDGIKKRGGV